MLNSFKKRSCSRQQWTCPLASGVVSASSRTLWRVYRNNVIECLVTVELTPPGLTYTLLRKTLNFFKIVYFSTVTVTPSLIMSIELLLFQIELLLLNGFGWNRDEELRLREMSRRTHFVSNWFVSGAPTPRIYTTIQLKLWSAESRKTFCQTSSGLCTD